MTDLEPMGYMWHFVDEPISMRKVVKNYPVDMDSWPDVVCEELFTLAQAKELLRNES